MREEAYEAFRRFYKDSGQTGYTLSSSAPMKFAATRAISARRASIARSAYKTDLKVAATSLLVPQEICWAAGYLPFNWEMFSSLLASHSGIIDLTNKGSVTTPRCSFINSLKGAYIDKLLPVPDVAISSGAYCEAIGFMVEEIGLEMGVNHHHLEIPLYANDSSVQTCAMHMREIFEQMSATNGMDKATADRRFRETMMLTTLAREVYLDIWQMRKDYHVNLGIEPLHWHMQFMPLWGDEAALRICKKLKEEIKDEIDYQKKYPKKGIPIGTFGLIPYGRTDLWRKLLDNNAYFVFEGVNYIGEHQLMDKEAIERAPINELFENVAYNLIQTPIRGGSINDRSKQFMTTASEMGAEGMIIFSHEHCQMLCPRLHNLEKNANDAGMDVVSISGDCILGMPPGPTGIRLGTFLSGLAGEHDTTSSSGIHSAVPTKLTGDFFRLGVDFGSGYSKYVVLDPETGIFQKGILSSGIDYYSLLNEIKSKIPGKVDYKLAVAGVGGDNPRFKDLAHVQTTEINALISTSKHLFADKTNLLVIDIGTQDVKVLKFTDMHSAPWLNTNKSCGAGTGLVLGQILERWKQSEPDMTFQKLDELAMQAKRAELINTTCGIFAVTSVVSALVQADEERRKEILRGVYQYIATQALKLLPAENQKGGELFLTGGVACHQSLRDIFTQRGYHLLSLPEGMHPQFLVAFGTALTIN